MIAKLRAWLLEIVREAIRLERDAYPEIIWKGSDALDQPPGTPWPRTVQPRVVSKPVTISEFAEPSFEQMQSDALKEQEKYYDPQTK